MFHLCDVLQLVINSLLAGHDTLLYVTTRAVDAGAVDEMFVEGYLIRTSDAYTALRTTSASTIVAEDRKTVTVANESMLYRKEKLAVTYVLEPEEDVCHEQVAAFFSLSNDRISLSSRPIS